MADTLDRAIARAHEVASQTILTACAQGYLSKEEEQEVVEAIDAIAPLARLEQDIVRVTSQADIFREIARVANQVSGAGIVVSHCVDRAIEREKERDRLRAEVNRGR